MSKRPFDEVDSVQTCESNLNYFHDKRVDLSYQSASRDAIKRRLWPDAKQQGRQHANENFKPAPEQRSHNNGDDHKAGVLRHIAKVGPKIALDPGELDEGKPKSLDEDRAPDQPVTSKHLIKTAADLPTFVTIGGFRVASYTVDDEPHLCLPNLLQFIQQKYPLDRVIDAFEKTVVTFKSATPKQVEGFIKAIALPDGAKDCPLIRLAEANKVCKFLCDQYADDKNSHGVEELKENHTENDCLLATSEDSTGAESGKGATNKNLRFASDEQVRQNENQNDKERSDTCSNDEPISTKREGVLVRTSEGVAGSRRSPRSEQSHPGHRSPDEANSDADTNPVFVATNHDTILNLARAVTSTLRIKVYHRCFGKCNGLFYPSKLKHSDSKCIECTTCHQILSPKKFIRHAHGSKEENVCHWGFDPNQWRHYICLYKNQDMNDLDEDELLVQLNTLKSIPDRESPCRDDYASPVNDDGRLSKLASMYDRSNHNRAAQEQNKLPMSSVVSLPSTRNMSSGTTSDQKSSAMHTNNPIGIVKPTILNPATSSASISSILENLVGKQKAEMQRNAFAWPFGQASMSGFIGKNPLGQHTLDASSCLNNAAQYPFNNLLANPLLFSQQHFDQSIPSSSHSNLCAYNMPRLEGKGASNILNQLAGRAPAVPASMSSHSSMADRLIKQDIFVSSSMATYLSSKCLDGDLVRDIIEQTLDAIRKSRLMF